MQASKETGKGPMEPPMEMTDLTRKKNKKSMQSGKRPMEPFSEAHRTSSDFDSQASQQTDKPPMEPPMEMTDLTYKKNNANKQATDGATLRRPPHEPEKRATERF